MIELSIALMAIMVFASRYVFLEPRLPLKLGPKSRRFLSFTVPAVLTSIWAPIVFLSDTDPKLILNPYIVGAAVTAAISFFANSVLMAALCGVAVFYAIGFMF